MTDGELSKDDQRMVALGYFKDWSNYLLVTTVAATGWVAKEPLSDGFHRLALGALLTSLVAGVITLALVPLVAEQIRDDDKSFYNVRAKFSLIGDWSMRIPAACRPQHIMLIIGAATYCIGSFGMWPYTHSESWVNLVLIIFPLAGLIIGACSASAAVESASQDPQKSPPPPVT